MSDDNAQQGTAHQPEPGEDAVETIRIISSAPEGFRRGGISHPKDATYPLSQFTEKQLEQIEAEPRLTIIRSHERPATRAKGKPKPAA